MSCPSGVNVIWPAVAGTRLMQVRMFIAARGSASHAGVLRIEERRRTDDRDRCRILLAEVLDFQFGPDLGVLGRQEAHQDGPADRRARSGARDVRAASVTIDEPLALLREDGLAAH